MFPILKLFPSSLMRICPEEWRRGSEAELALTGSPPFLNAYWSQSFQFKLDEVVIMEGMSLGKIHPLRFGVESELVGCWTLEVNSGNSSTTVGVDEGLEFSVTEVRSSSLSPLPVPSSLPDWMLKLLSSSDEVDPGLAFNLLLGSVWWDLSEEFSFLKLVECVLALPLERPFRVEEDFVPSVLDLDFLTLPLSQGNFDFCFWSYWYVWMHQEKNAQWVTMTATYVFLEE